jgi:ABC-type protease/lipase transport system fused ATPase/permease subunit
MVFTGALSCFVKLLMLVVPLYTIQVERSGYAAEEESGR